MTDDQVYEIATYVDNSPAGMLRTVIEAGQDIEKMEKWLDLQIRYEANEARKAYHKAMAAFKANPPEIDKDRHVSFSTTKGMTEYDHASLANVTDKINRALSKHELSAGWKTQQGEGGMISVTCTITHALGHSESTTLSAGPDQSGGKNNIQAIGSTLSYLERYTILALTGLSTKDMDDDGKASENIEYIQGEDLDHIKKLVGEVVENKNAFLKVAGAESIETIPTKNRNKVLALLNKKRVELAKKRLADAEKNKATDREPGSDDS